MQYIKNHLIAVLFFTLVLVSGFARPIAEINPVKADIITDLEAYWKFDEDNWDGTVDEVYDSTGNGYDGTIVAGPNVTTGVIGNAANLNSTSDYIGVGTTQIIGGTNITEDFTIAGWARTSVPGRPIFSQGYTGDTDVLFEVIPGQADIGIGINIRNTSGTIFQTIEGAGAPNRADGLWHHYVVSRVGSTMYLYVDGQEVFSKAFNPTGSFPIDRIYIGRRAGSSLIYQGQIDDLRLYTRGLDSEDVTELYEFTYEEQLGITGITDNEWDGVSQTEICLSYGSPTEFANTDTITFNFIPAFTSPVLDSTPPDADADNDSTSEGSFTTLSSSQAIYTFTDSTTQAESFGINLCLDLPSGQSSSTHAITFTDSIGNFGATLLHVADNNDVTVTLEITPTLSFNIRTLDDSADTNTCDLGAIDTTTLPNTDTTDDGAGECGYSLAIGTNATSGFQVQITSDGNLRNASSSIINAAEDQSIAAGAEAYGLINITAAQTGSDGGGNFDQAITKDGNFADDNDYTPVPQTPTNFVSYTDGVDYLAGTDSTDVTQVMHGMTVGSGTPAGLYQQVVTYTTTVTF